LATLQTKIGQDIKIEVWFQDEARIGQKNGLTRRWAPKGTRPRGAKDQRYDWAYMFGAICPHRGVGSALVMPACNAHVMALHLQDISSQVAPGAHGLIIMDQAGWHTTGQLTIPDNLTLLMLPPKSPELNPVEKVWQFLKETYLSNRIFNTYDDIVEACCWAWQKLSNEEGRITSIGSFHWIGQS